MLSPARCPSGGGRIRLNNQYFRTSEGYFGLDAPRSTPFNRWIRVETLYDQTGHCEDSTILALPGVSEHTEGSLGTRVVSHLSS